MTKSSFRSRLPRRLGWVPVLVAAGTVVNGIRLRRRLGHLATLEPAQAPVSASHRFVTVAGVQLDEATRRAASAHARREGLAVVDLVPADLPVDRALELGQRVNPATFRTAHFALGRGACHALLVESQVLERAGISRLEGLDAVELARLTLRLKRYASTGTDLVVAPGLHAVPEQPGIRRALLPTTYPYPVWSELVLAGPPLRHAALVAGLLAARAWGAVAAGLVCLQPYLVFGGSAPLVPRDLHRTALTRLAQDPWRWLRTLTGGQPAADEEDPYERRRPAYAADIAAGIERFFEPRRTDCPWCGSTDLAVRLVTSDLVQGKPGRFALERCKACGHIFQNPRLSVAGLEFYYRDWYDGLNAEVMETAFASFAPTYRDRALMVKPFATPKAWLDVGAAHGHFCAVAREVWPETVFDGLDISESIEEAECRGWVNQGYRGMFPELAAELAGRYDVVSMHHYLEHTREPFAELDAAARVLPAAGHLLIEVPNPDSRFGTLLGRYWMPWLQPQHQHFIPLRNLEQALADRGFTVVAVHRGPANMPLDLMTALWQVLNHWVPNPRLPWSSHRPTRRRRAAYTAVAIVALPLLVGTTLVDQLIHHAFVRHTRGGNTYRVLARKDS